MITLGGHLRSLAIFAILLATVLAGCSGSAGSDDDTETPKGVGTPGTVKVTDSTGGIRGIVVDGAIRPVAEATVRVTGGGTDEKTVTDTEGTFTISGLDAGTYFIEASHPLYDKVQQTASVEAGVEKPDLVKIQLTRVVLVDPYTYTVKEEGYITCSANVIVGYSEECGEGVGVPCDSPVMPCERIGGQANNRPEIDFYVEDPSIRTIVVEQVWEPSTSYSPPNAPQGEFQTYVSIDWICDPLCGGIRLAMMEGPSPLRAQVNIDNATAIDQDGEAHPITTESRFSTFTYANDNGFPAGSGTSVLVEQEFTVYLTYFYVLPAPEDWSFVEGDPEPF